MLWITCVNIIVLVVIVIVTRNSFLPCLPLSCTVSLHAPRVIPYSGVLGPLVPAPVFWRFPTPVVLFDPRLLVYARLCLYVRYLSLTLVIICMYSAYGVSSLWFRDSQLVLRFLIFLCRWSEPSLSLYSLCLFNMPYCLCNVVVLSLFLTSYVV